MEHRFCVYLHKDDEGTVKYVGEGLIPRAYVISTGRNKKWKETFNYQNPVVEIIEMGLTKQEARDLEKELIEFFRDTIINSPYSHNKGKSIDIEYLKEFIYYSETSKSGLRYLKDCRSGIHGNSFSRRKDAEAGFKDKNGYWSVKINNITYKVHRLIFMLHGFDLRQNDMVNHKDHNPSNNIISNLEISDSIHNSRNKKQRKNVDGIRGITKRSVSGIDYLVYTISFISNRKQFTVSLREYTYESAQSVLIKTKNKVEEYLMSEKTFNISKFKQLFEEEKGGLIAIQFKESSTME